MRFRRWCCEDELGTGWKGGEERIWRLSCKDAEDGMNVR